MKTVKGLLYRVRLTKSPSARGGSSRSSPPARRPFPGDTAMAVHPADERYQDLIGLHVWRAARARADSDRGLLDAG